LLNLISAIHDSLILLVVAVRAAPAIKVIALGNGQNNKDSSHENNV
jgi:hypothetical protein